MSIASSDLITYWSANAPTTDAATSGGAIDTTSRPEFTQFTASAIAQVVSDGADVRTVTVTGRLASGVIDTEILTLNGTTPVSGAKTWERVLKLVASATSATRTITVKQGAGGSTCATIGVNETTRQIVFYDSASSTSGTTDRYEKLFMKNTNATLSLLNAQVTLTADPAARIKIGLATAVDGSTSVANRLTAPAGVSFVDDGVAQSVPGTNLAAGSAIGVWIDQTLPANDPANKSTFTLQLAGSSV